MGVRLTHSTSLEKNMAVGPLPLADASFHRRRTMGGGFEDLGMAEKNDPAGRLEETASNPLNIGSLSAANRRKTPLVAARTSKPHRRPIMIYVVIERQYRWK